MSKIVTILGVAIHDISLKELKLIIAESIISAKKLFLVSANSELLESCFWDKKLQQSLATAYCFPESIGLKIAYRKFQAIIPGIDLAEQILQGELGDGVKDYSVYLYGGNPAVVAKVAAKYDRVGGYCDGYSERKTASEMIVEIKRLKPAVVLVALGGGRQESWIADNIADLPVSVLFGVGGSFDVLAGTVKRAPRLFRRFGLEWLYRIVVNGRFKRLFSLFRYLLLITFKRTDGSS